MNAFVNKVEGMRTKWLNDPMKQAFAGDLKKLVDLFQPVRSIKIVYCAH